MNEASSNPIPWHPTDVHGTFSEEDADVIPIELSTLSYLDVNLDLRGLRSLLLMYEKKSSIGAILN